MGLFDFLKGKKTVNDPVAGDSYFHTGINDQDLKVLINQAILAFRDDQDADQVIGKIKSYRNEEPLALALYRFIPIALCRLFIPEPAYSDEYVVVKSEKDQSSYKLSEDRIYQQVMTELGKWFTTEASQEKLLAILCHSADFQAINNALRNGSNLADLDCGPSYFV